MMLREDYIKELRSRLQGLDEDEIKDAISYCEEYFDEAENPDTVLADLGTPAKFASQIKAESAFKTTQNPSNYHKPHSMMKSFGMILGGICALPIALPIVLTAVILIFVFGLVIFILAMCGIIVVIALLYAAIASLILGIINSGGVGDMLLHIGVSLMLFSVCILCSMGVYIMIRKVLPKFVDTISQFYHRHKKGEVTHENN